MSIFHYLHALIIKLVFLSAVKGNASSQDLHKIVKPDSFYQTT